MDLRRALTYLFADPRWPAKLGVAMLLNLLPTALSGYWQLRVAWDGGTLSADPVGAFVWNGLTTFAMIPLYGYLLRIVRNLVAGTDLPLPEWSDAGRLLRDGLSLWGIVVLWGLPSTLLGAIVDPFIVGADLGRVMVGLVFMLFVLVVVFAVLVVQPAAEARLAVTGSFRAGVDVRAALATVRRNRGGYVRLFLVTLAGGLGVAGIGFGLVWLAKSALGGATEFQNVLGVSSVVVAATVGPYLQFVLYHLYGQVYGRTMQ